MLADGQLWSRVSHDHLVGLTRQPRASVGSGAGAVAKRPSEDTQALEPAKGDGSGTDFASSERMKRRAFLGASMVLAACRGKTGPTSASAPAEGQIPLAPAVISAAQMPKRPLGKTGVQVSRIGLGGAHIGRLSDEQESIRIIRRAIDRGVTFMDNAWDYGRARSEWGRRFATVTGRKPFL